MNDSLKRWIEENKLMVSESKINGLDTIIIDGVGTFLFLHSNEEKKIIDADFAFILSDEEFDVLDKKLVDYILFEFGEKFYYSKIKQSKNKYNELIYQPEFNDFKYLGCCSEPFVMDFVHLGVHDEYEMLSGSGACDLWCKKAKFLGHKAIGVCDANTLASSLAFQTYAQKFGLKAIIGETITVARNYNPEEDIQETFELKLYVLSEIGWRNLLIISKTINVDYDGFIPAEELYKFGTGLCCVIPKFSEFNYLINNSQKKEAIKLLDKYKQCFDDVYYQIDTVEFSSKQLFLQHLQNIDNYILHFRKKVKPILINDSYYLDQEEQQLKGMLHKISGKAAPEALNQYFKSVGDTIKSYEEWIEDTELLFNVIVEGISNTKVLSESVRFTINNSERKIPKFEVADPESLFFKELEKGIEKKLIGKVDNIDDYLSRIQTECELIVPNDLCSYFLILWDISNWCRSKDIMIGPGRGSVCGSLVAYCLDITSVDPLKYQLYFERFLNAARVSAHHAYNLTLEDGREVVFRDGDKIPLTDGRVVEVGVDEIDFHELDINVDML
jgi:DNA polymerase-3 subunit alpha